MYDNIRYMIDVLKKIEKLRIERNWSIYKLAEEAEITQSTIANMFYRKTLPSIKTLEAICGAFNMSLSEFFSEEDNAGYTSFSLNTNYRNLALIDNYNKLAERDKLIIDQLIKYMLER